METIQQFRLGKLVSTPGALDALGGQGLMEAIFRHLQADWSEMSGEDKMLNLDAIIKGERIFSSFHVNGVKVWVITEAGREYTTVLLPEEY